MLWGGGQTDFLSTISVQSLHTAVHTFTIIYKKRKQCRTEISKIIMIKYPAFSAAGPKTCRIQSVLRTDCRWRHFYSPAVLVC